MNAKTIIELGFRIIWRIASTDITLHDLHNSSYDTKAEFNNRFIIYSK